MADQNRISDTGFFQWKGRPSWPAALPQALQHILAMLVGNMTAPLLLAANLGLPEEDTVLLMQAALIVAGVTTLLQLFPYLGFGMGLPNVSGTAFAYLPILIVIGHSYGMPVLFGAQLIGGVASIFVGVILGKIRHLFPPIVTGTVVLTIGVSLFPTAITYMAGGSDAGAAFGSAKFWIIALIVLAVTLICNLSGKENLKVLGMLLGIAVGYAVSLIWGGMIDFRDVATAQWVALPKIFPFGIEFKLFPSLLMIFMYLLQSVQTIGDVCCTTIGGFDRDATDRELSGAVKTQGVCGILAALIGGLPTGTYGQNMGLVVSTKVVARRVFILVGAILLAAGFLPKFGALITTIPYPVLGGATVAVFAAITMSGMDLIASQENSYRNKTIVGTALALGIGLTYVPTALDQTPAILQEILTSSPILVSFLVAFVLNIVVPEEKEDKLTSTNAERIETTTKTVATEEAAPKKADRPVKAVARSDVS